jgi:hypothetical protein
MYVLRLGGVAAVGARGGRRDRTDQIRVRHRVIFRDLIFFISDAIRFRYENGIQTFDTANVSLSNPFLDLPHRRGTL